VTRAGADNETEAATTGADASFGSGGGTTDEV